MFHSNKRAFAGAALAAGAALILAGCAGGSTPEAASTYDPDEEVTLDFAFWGNDVRAELYNEAIAAFNEEYPNITVNPTFLAWDEYWEKRQTEAAGKNLPDVFQMDMTYVRQYSENGLLLDLTPYLGGIIATDGYEQSVLDIASINDTVAGMPISTNTLGMFENPTLAGEVGVEGFGEGTWADFEDWLYEVKDAADAAGVEAWGSGNPYGFIQSFELTLRSEGKSIFTEDGEVGFTEEDLTDFWNQAVPLIEDGAVIPQQRIEELSPLGPFDAAKTLSEITWDNFGAGYLANLGENYPTVDLVAPPVTEEGAKDLYMKAGMLLSGAAGSDHPEAAATFIDFMVNSPEAGAIFGTNRGMPASETQRAGIEIDATAQQILDYEASVADRIGDPPPVPIVGYGSVEAKFKELAQELGFGTISVDDAVSQLFAEIDVIVNQ
ncbi:multiple sugar transport system substrate-binding protein [Microbacterium terrae]|uniref:ABC transporter substrate-binding protein YesO n=1 Tax=Microbacterium terrae TaxID=69369 RepID=A0A0M2HJG0_9MICO|nr:extracellular solute-binding protein [Microbacterium terrae]KJL44498.1 putative ABC transporter substrate-binding protein YesO [Microbacterium terrae]MBP1079499.1 multiple sugar transport system substrate-binding protein [Microbacterium terrae]GLJ96840.1 lipoprotein [Microbacterium terrae]